MEKKVQAPAIALLVVAALTALLYFVSLFGNDWALKFVEQAEMPEEQQIGRAHV